MQRQQVAVIGAGAAGLCAARYLADKPNLFEPVVFEKADCVGGTWVYVEETGHDRYGLAIHSSMYKNLKTNLPKEVMAFPDFPFDQSLPSFVTHKDVIRYLEQYAAKFNLLKYIKFQTVVDTVTPVTKDNRTMWEVTVRDLTNCTDGIRTSLFDAVIVCNGHNSVPKIPKFKGQESFPGTIMHSHVYREPESFKDRSVVCIGAGSSGQDIILDLHPHANMVYLSHWKGTLQSEFPKNVLQVPPVDHIHGKQVVFIDGQTCEADTIILCTGYERCTFPFLTKECHVTVEAEHSRVTPLYKHLVHTEFQTLSFLGLPSQVAPFPLFSCQVRLVVAILEGSFKLPPKEEIEAENKADLQRRLDMGWPRRYAHKFGALQWEYNNKLAQLAGATPINPVIESLYDEVAYHRRTNVRHYRKLNYETVDEKTWRQVSRQGSGDA